jgi:hypothetical protein
LENVAHRILNDPTITFLRCGGFLRGPLVSALRADEEETILVGVFGVAFRTVGEVFHAWVVAE